MARPSERCFILAYTRKEGARPTARPARVVGIALGVHIGSACRPRFMLMCCGEDWRSLDTLFFDAIEELWLVAEAFFGIQPRDWIGCHPRRGDALYSPARTPVERVHRALLRRIDLHRRHSGSVCAHYRERAAWAGFPMRDSGSQPTIYAMEAGS